MENSKFRLGKWTRIVEAADKVKVKQGMGQKVVLIPKDARTLEIKVVNDADVLTPDQKLTPSGFTAILNFIKQQASIINNYPALNNLKDNLVVYTVAKDTNRTQKITFTIGSKAEVGGVNPDVTYVRQDELDLAKTGAILNTGDIAKIKKPDQPAQTAKVSFTLPLSAESIPGSTDSRVVEFVKNAYLKIKQEPAISSNPIMAKVRSEVNLGKLGNASKLFIKGLNAGFNIREWSGEDVETAITKKLVDKLGAVKSPSNESRKFYLGLTASYLVEAVSEIIDGFDIDSFMAAVKAVTPGTGDIKVPEEGFKYGISGDSEFKKFQDILVKNLPTYAGGSIKKDRPVANFIKAVPMKGDYGNRTKDLVLYLKYGLSDPKYPDNDGQVIKADFVERMLKEFKLIGENRVFLGTDGQSLIVEGFDRGAAVSATGSSGGGGGGKGGGGTAPVKKKEGGTIRYPEGSFEFKVENGFWVYRKKGSSDSWKKASNTKNITLLQREFPKDGGNYVRPSDLNYVYKFEGGTWKVKSGDSWINANDTSKAELNKLYTTALSSGGKDLSKAMTVKKIDELHIEIANTIKGWFDSDRFEDFGGGMFTNDKEEEAWKYLTKTLWSSGEKSVGKKLKKTAEAISLIGDPDAKARLNKNQWFLTAMGKDGSNFNKSILNRENEYTISLVQADGIPKKIRINTDI